MKPESETVAAFARRLGVEPQAVWKAIRTGRLEQSVVYVEGLASIADVALATQEWTANAQRQTKGRGSTRSIVEERRELIKAQRRKVNLEMRQKRGDLVPRRAMEIRFSTRVVTARTKLLALPSRMKQRLPHLTASDLAVLDALIREALDELVDGQ